MTPIVTDSSVTPGAGPVGVLCGAHVGRVVREFPGQAAVERLVLGLLAGGGAVVERGGGQVAGERV